MMITKQVTLSTGETVTVAPVPNKIYDIVRLRFPYPEVPFIEDSNTATGEPVRVSQPDDPEYKREKLEIDEKRMEGWAEAQMLFGLSEMAVPEGWEPPAEELLYLTQDWQPRQGPMGRKLDWIEWDLLRNPADSTKIINIISSFASVDEKAVETIEESFRSNLEGETA